MGTSRRDVVAPNHAYQCGKKMKSTYLETTVFSRAVCPVRVFAPAEESDGTTIPFRFTSLILYFSPLERGGNFLLSPATA